MWLCCCSSGTCIVFAIIIMASASWAWVHQDHRHRHFQLLQLLLLLALVPAAMTLPTYIVAVSSCLDQMTLGWWQTTCNTHSLMCALNCHSLSTHHVDLAKDVSYVQWSALQMRSMGRQRCERLLTECPEPWVSHAWSATVCESMTSECWHWLASTSTPPGMWQSKTEDS